MSRSRPGRAPQSIRSIPTRLTYARALAELERLTVRAVRPGLSRTRFLLSKLNHPDRACPAVQVTGTNGKGSVTALLATALTASGWRTGRFTSPHLAFERERVAVDNLPLSAAAFTAALAPMLPALRQLKRSGNPATTFEAWTVLAAEAFRQAEVDLAVVEVGMGGRLDATSAWDRKVLCLLTQVSLEHTRELGPDRTAICQEKVAIARPGVPFLSAEADPALRALIRKHGRTTGCPVEFIGTEVHDAGRLLDWQRTEYGVRVSMNLRGQALTLGVGLRGEHQAYNAVLAALAVQTLSRCGYPVSLRAWQRSFRRVAWPGRLERIQRNPDVFLDGAHNPDAARVVAQEMQIMHRPVFLVTGIMADKDVAGVIRALAPAVRQVWTVTPPDSRGLPAPKLAAGFRAANVPAQACRSLGQAVHAALAAANRHGVVLVTGSLYILESARRALIRAGKTHLTSTRR